MYSLNGTEILHKNLLIDNNLASENAVLYIFDSSFKELLDSESFSFSRNLGSLLAFNSNISLSSVMLHLLITKHQNLMLVQVIFTKEVQSLFFRAMHSLTENAALNTTMLTMVDQYIPQRAKFM